MSPKLEFKPRLYITLAPRFAFLLRKIKENKKEKKENINLIYWLDFMSEPQFYNPQVNYSNFSISLCLTSSYFISFMVIKKKSYNYAFITVLT